LGAVVRVAGVAVSATGQPLSNISVGIANVTAGTMFTSLGGVRAAATGEFSLSGLTPGRWLLFGRGAEGPTGDRGYPLWTHTEVVVGDKDVTGVVMQFLPASTVKGRIEFQGAAARPDLSTLRLSLTPLPAIAGTGPILPAVVPRPDGSFTIESVPPGKYRVALNATGAWALHSAMSDDRDTLDVPLEMVPGRDATLILTMTDRPTEISGALVDQLGRSAPEYSVVVFTAERALWTTAPRRNSGIVRLGSDGRFRITGLPAGQYLLCVITDAESGQLTDLSFLEQLAKAGVPVTLADGEKREQNLKIGGW
jgi:hypothetical protein